MIDATRCRVCHRDMPPESGVVRDGLLDPVCPSCVGKVNTSNDARMFEEAAARIEAIARAAKDDVSGCLRKQLEVHSVLGTHGDQIKVLEQAVSRICAQIENVQRELAVVGDELRRGGSGKEK